jgi:pimeloyl-ACP methyl ester carboxylesterase
MARHVEDLDVVLSFAREKYSSVVDSRVLLIGHSLGAAVSCKYAAREHGRGERRSILGLILLDFVEGPALATAQSTYAHLQGIPPSFPNLGVTRS